MNRDNHLIYEGYRQKRHLTPKESLQRDKEFFNYVIESNVHLSSLKKFSTKKLFSSYVSTLANRIESNNPGLIRESNMSDAEAFGILNEATQTVTDQEAYDAVKDIFEEIAVKQLIRKADLFLEADGDPNELVNRPMARRPGQRDAQGRMLPGQGAAQVQNQAQRDRVAGKMRDLRAANQTAAARIAELEAKIQEMEAAEANMNQQQKAQSDSIQDQLAAMIKQIQTNNTATAANQNVINIGGTGIGTGGNPNTSQGQLNAPGNQGQLNATNNTNNSIAQNAAAANQKGNPGIWSKMGSAAKKYLLNPNTLGLLGGAAGTFIPGVGNAVGGAIGGALGKGLGRAFQTKGNLGQKLGAGLGGAATGALAGAGMGAGVDALGLGGAGDASSAITDTGASAAAEPGPYANTNPSQPYTPGTGDSGNMLPGFQDDAVNSTGMPDEYAQPGDQGAAEGTGLPTDVGETQEGDDEPAKRQYKSVNNTKGAQRQMELSRGNR